MDYHEYIIRDKNICGGAPVFKGTRVTLRTVLANIAEGLSENEILESYPTLKSEHLRAAHETWKCKQASNHASNSRNPELRKH